MSNGNMRIKKKANIAKKKKTFCARTRCFFFRRVDKPMFCKIETETNFCYLSHMTVRAITRGEKPALITSRPSVETQSTHCHVLLKFFTYCMSSVQNCDGNPASGWRSWRSLHPPYLMECLISPTSKNQVYIFTMSFTGAWLFLEIRTRRVLPTCFKYVPIDPFLLLLWSNVCAVHYP